MKATTFISGLSRRIAQRVARLSAESRGHGERAECMPSVAEVVEQVLSLIAIEEDLLFPALAELAAARFPPARLEGLRDELARVEAALHGVVAATDATFEARVAALDEAVGAHGGAIDALLPEAESSVEAPVLDELGARMERFYAGSVVAAHGPVRRPRAR